MTPVCTSLRRYLYEGAYSKDGGEEIGPALASI